MQWIINYVMPKLLIILKIGSHNIFIHTRLKLEFGWFMVNPIQQHFSFEDPYIIWVLVVFFTYSISV